MHAEPVEWPAPPHYGMGFDPEALEGWPEASPAPSSTGVDREAETMALAMQIEGCWSFGELQQLSREVGLAAFSDIHISVALQVLVTLHCTAYTLHPTPYTLHPTSYALHPTPTL